ncbi:hypothetical protein BEP19_10220 [Ammoniphilus oxalaticus]|uniref:Uncharacterized protein n=1 Tax=Ammoniphilus oxalaticus TaxID=66863 RepID=A0A419SFS2_9BACL|nr:hypothetical protein [Ammoniphilus oxalaticus]RKD22627.1 hypothetical protein BEP19_10220 [Ammoniphilus oxalaticus]
MKSESIHQLLRVGYLLHQKQTLFKRIFNVNADFFNEELNLLLHVILIHMEIIQEKDQSIMIVNQDHYEYVTKIFWNYCEGQVSVEDVIELIQDLKVEHSSVRYGENGEPLMRINPTNSMNVLFKIKYSIQQKRSKFGDLIGSERDFLRAENKIIQVALGELGRTGYFAEDGALETLFGFEASIQQVENAV